MGAHDKAAVYKRERGDMCGFREGGFNRFGVAIMIVECHIARHVIVKNGRAILRGGLGVGNRG